MKKHRKPALCAIVTVEGNDPNFGCRCVGLYTVTAVNATWSEVAPISGGEGFGVHHNHLKDENGQRYGDHA